MRGGGGCRRHRPPPQRVQHSHRSPLGVALKAPAVALQGGGERAERGDEGACLAGCHLGLSRDRRGEGGSGREVGVGFDVAE